MILADHLSHGWVLVGFLVVVAILTSCQGPDRGDPVPFAGSGEGWYTVQAGDTLESIAKKFSEPVKTLIERNQITGTTSIHPGYNLIINYPGSRVLPL